MPAQHKIRDARTYQMSHRMILCALVLAILVTPAVTSLLAAPVFADVSPEFTNSTTSTRIYDAPVELAAANLPSIGGPDDYMNQSGDGGSGAGAPPQTYSPQASAPPGYAPQGVPPQEWNNRYADPNAERSVLIGAAVVGAVAIGMWALQQHEQAQRRARRRFYSRQRAFD